MAIQTSIPVNFEAYFPRGAFMVGEVEPVVKWSDDGQRQGQDLDKNTGHPLWQVRVIDADPDARKRQNEVTVKLASIAKPTAPPEVTSAYRTLDASVVTMRCTDSAPRLCTSRCSGCSRAHREPCR